MNHQLKFIWLYMDSYEFDLMFHREKVHHNLRRFSQEWPPAISKLLDYQALQILTIQFVFWPQMPCLKSFLCSSGFGIISWLWLLEQISFWWLPWCSNQQQSENFTLQDTFSRRKCPRMTMRFTKRYFFYPIAFTVLIKVISAIMWGFVAGS